MAALEGMDGVHDCKEFKFTEELLSWKTLTGKLRASCKAVVNEQVVYHTILTLPDRTTDPESMSLDSGFIFFGKFYKS